MLERRLGRIARNQQGSIAERGTNRPNLVMEKFRGRCIWPLEVGHQARASIKHGWLLRQSYEP